jgi:hypothetical protein
MPGRASLSGEGRDRRPVLSRQEKTMLAHLSRQGTHPRAAARTAGARLRRLAAVLTAVTCALLASAAVVPAAFATIVPPGPGGSGTTGLAPVPAATVRVISAGGMAGWQITLIALGAALVAAAAAVLLDRTLAARRAASIPTA